MGGIADYSGSLVLQLPLDRATWVAAQATPDREITVASRRGDRWESVTADLVRQPAPGHWASYIIGVAQRLGARTGLRLAVVSTVPEGKGVSSSAALEVAAMSAIAAAWGISIAPETMAAECQWVENHIVGAPCGIMDQMTAACGREQRLLRLLCRPATIEGYVEVPSGFRFYGIDSGVRHAVTGADYRTVRTAAFMGKAMIEGAARGQGGKGAGLLRYLTEISPEEFGLACESHLPEHMLGGDFLLAGLTISDPVTTVKPDEVYPVRAATAHPVHEHRRVTHFAALLPQLGSDRSVAEELGTLMLDAHAGYSSCGLGTGATDRIVERVMSLGPAHGLYGAKITGGGSGGTVAVLGTVEAETLVRQIAGGNEVFVASGPGAAETGVQRIDAAGES